MNTTIITITLNPKKPLSNSQYKKLLRELKKMKKNIAYDTVEPVLIEDMHPRDIVTAVNRGNIPVIVRPMNSGTPNFFLINYSSL
jgi:hypothetical protein